MFHFNYLKRMQRHTLSTGEITVGLSVETEEKLLFINLVTKLD